MSASPKGRLIVISGPSGVGKSSIVDAVLARTDARFSVSATTRAARPDEVEGTDYAFSMTREEFGALREAGEILEWAEYGGNLYGTLRRAVLPLVEAGHDVILDIENEGAKQIRAAFGDALMIFIAPPGSRKPGETPHRQGRHLSRGHGKAPRRCRGSDGRGVRGVRPYCGQ